jgi:hypothetical protein
VHRSSGIQRPLLKLYRPSPAVRCDRQRSGHKHHTDDHKNYGKSQDNGKTQARSDAWHFVPTLVNLPVTRFLIDSLYSEFRWCAISATASLPSTMLLLPR